MKKSKFNIGIFIAIIIFFSLLVFFCQPVLAEDKPLLEKGLTTAADQAGLVKTTSLSATIGKVVKVFLQFLGIIFLILIVYAGLTWMTAGGRPDTIKKAKGFLIHAAIGLAITLMAYQLSSYVIEKIQIKQTPAEETEEYELL